MKVCYQALLDLYTEIEEKLINAGNLYRIREAVSLNQGEGKNNGANTQLII